MSNDFSTDDCVDEGICLDSANNADRMLKPKVYFLPAHYSEMMIILPPLLVAHWMEFPWFLTVAFQPLLNILVTIYSIVGGGSPQQHSKVY